MKKGTLILTSLLEDLQMGPSWSIVPPRIVWPMSMVFGREPDSELVSGFDKGA